MTTDAQVGVIDQTAAGSSNTKPIDTVQLFNTAGTSVGYRQTMVLGDPSLIAGFAPVNSVMGLSVYALDYPPMRGLLADIKAELQNLARLLGGMPVTEV